MAWRTQVVICCSLFAPPSFGADSPRALVERGNAAFAAGKYQQALEAYQSIPDEQLTDRNRAEILHDRAAAYFKLGQIAEARESWVRAAGLKDAGFEARAQYNLGNCDHAEALQAAQAGNANLALEKLGKAMERYREAIRLDPDLANARANLELAGQLRKQIEEQSATQPSSQPDSDKKNKDQSPHSQPSSQPQDQQDQQDQQGGQGQGSQPASRPESQPSEGESDPNDPNQAQPQPQSQPQPNQSQPAEDEMDADPGAASRPSESQPAQSQAAQSQPAASQPNSGQVLQMSPQEAERLLQMIRDAEKQRREVLRRREAAKYRPVERDW